VSGQQCLLAEGDIGQYIDKGFNSFTSPIGGPNSSVRLAYFHANCLLTELYKQETEINGRKADGHIKK
jgi:hypothetical protein